MSPQFHGLPTGSLNNGHIYLEYLQEAGPRIVAARAAARVAHGWIMDIYLMRRD